MQSLTSPPLPPPPPPPPSGGPNCLRGPDHHTSQYGEIVWRGKRRKSLVPCLKGLGELVTAQIFLGHFSWAPKKARFVQPLLVLWPHRSFPTMGTNGDNFRLLLIEDPALKAQPRNEVAVGVGQNLSPGHNTVGPSARFTEDLRPCS